VFVVACALWYVDNRKPKEPTNIEVEVKTGELHKATILGAEAAEKGRVTAKIKTGDASEAHITGFREK
jgi:hypothetical protein